MVTRDFNQETATASWPERLPVDTLVERVREYIRSPRFDPPPLPSVAQEVWSACSTGEATAMQVARIVQRGPLLAGRVMRVANSALLTGTEPARTLRDAVVRIGFDELVNIVLMVSLRSILYDVPGFLHLGESSRRGAVASALASSLLAEKAGVAPAARAFLAGLLHDIGEPVLMHALERLVGHDYCLDMAEREYLALNREIHAEIGLEVAAQWRLDAELKTVIARHNDWLSPAAQSPLVRVVMLADAIVAQMGIGLNDLIPTPEDHPLATDPAFPPDLVEEVRTELPEKLAAFE